MHLEIPERLIKNMFVSVELGFAERLFRSTYKTNSNGLVPDSEKDENYNTLRRDVDVKFKAFQNDNKEKVKDKECEDFLKKYRKIYRNQPIIRAERAMYEKTKFEKYEDFKSEFLLELKHQEEIWGK